MPISDCDIEWNINCEPDVVEVEETDVLTVQDDAPSYQVVRLTIVYEHNKI